MKVLLVLAACMASVPLSAQTLLPGDSCEDKMLTYASSKVKPDSWAGHLKDPNGTGRLYYFGAEHSADTGHQQFRAIAGAWDMIKPTIAFFEGPDRGIGATAQETISRLGESGYVRYLAKAAGIPTRSLEDRPGEYRYLVSVYGKEKVQLFYILGEASRLHHRKGMNETEVAEEISRLLPKMKVLLLQGDSTGGDLLSIAAIEQAYRKYWQEGAWWKAPGSWFDPQHTSAQTGGVFTNEINRSSSEWRNKSMYHMLTVAVLSGERVFAVVGRNHVPLQLPAIKCRLGVSD